MVFWIVLLMLAISTPAVADLLTPEQQRGKQIYLNGSSSSGRAVTALIGKVAIETPSAAAPCASCHGDDGLGRPEGGIAPANITWEHLAKSYGHHHPNGRKHTAFTEKTLATAIIEGLDPAGNKLEAAMPRYAMAEPDMADLVAYLKRLETDRPPGVTEDMVTLGTLLPLQGRLAEMGQAMRAVMTACFDEVNARGGIYNRRLKLEVSEYPEAQGEAAITNLRRLIDGREVFALVGAFAVGAEKELAALVENETVPLVGPFTLSPQADSGVNSFTFYIFSGVEDQARVLLDYAAQKLPLSNPRVAVVYPGAGPFLGVVDAIAAQVKKHQWSPVDKLGYLRDQFVPARFVPELRGRDIDVVFFLGSGEELRAWMEEAGKRHWTPYVFLSGPLAGKDILDLSPDFAKDKIFLAYPTLPTDQTRAGVMEFKALQEKYHLTRGHLAAQISAFSAAKVLIEGLKLVGKDLSREKLVRAFEAVREFDTGLTPRITYGPNRHVGALGAYIVTVDPEKNTLVPVSAWITP
jgi:ABC-type branched-subunit amino acid transport system substrate-binding protein